MYKAFLDCGFGYTKAIDSNNNKVLHPSIYSELPIGLNGTELGIYSDFGNFLFGESASNISAMSRRFQEYRDCLSNAYVANVLLAISEMNGANVIDCELVLSLPFQSMRGDLPAKLMSKLAGSHIIKRLGYHKQTINITFPIKWPVMPQNVAPAFVSLAPNGKFKSDATGLIWIGVINVGSKDIELGTFGIDVDNYKLKASSQHWTFPKGMYTLADTVQPLLIDALAGKRTSFSQYEIFQSLITGKIQYGNQMIDVFEIIQPVKQGYNEIVHNLCLQNWTGNRGKEPGELYQFCGAGGGGQVIAPYLRDVNFHNNIVVSDEPQFDVCYGSKYWHRLIGG